jgi:type III pantothenate kinase
MLIVFDVGNTETVIGIYNKEDLKSHLRLSSKSSQTSDEYWLLIKVWCESEGIKMSDIEGAVLSSVVPYLTSIYIKVIKEKLDLEPLVVSTDIKTGIKVLYDTPRTVGADRICNAVAGFHLYGGPLIVVDFGTATTFDVISKIGEYSGGVIAPGLMGASQELHRLAAKLPRVSLVFPATVVGKTTETSIQSGIMWGMVSLVDGVIERIKQELKWEDTQVIATGGIGSLIVEKLENIKIYKPFLTLEGMKFIYYESN